MVFVAVLGNACGKLREAAQDTSEEWLETSGSLSWWRTSRGHGILSGHWSDLECVTNSSAWEAVCLSSRWACVNTRHRLNRWPAGDQHNSATRDQSLKDFLQPVVYIYKDSHPYWILLINPSVSFPAPLSYCSTFPFIFLSFRLPRGTDFP